MSMTAYDYNFDLAVREDGAQVVVTNNLGRTASYGEFVYLGGYFGYVADYAGIANAATGRIQLVSENVEISTAQIDATDTFTKGNSLYFTPGGSSAAGLFVDTPVATSLRVGKITDEQGTGGAQTAVSFRPIGIENPVVGVGSSVKVARVIIDAATDYSTVGKATGIPVGSILLDALAICTAASSSGTAQVVVGTTGLFTALTMAVDKTINRMAAAVEHSKLVTDAAVTVKTHGIGDAGIVEIFYI